MPMTLTVAINRNVGDQPEEFLPRGKNWGMMSRQLPHLTR